MGDRIDDLPVDQILPSKEEREILNTLYDPRERYHPDSGGDDDSRDKRSMMAAPSRASMSSLFAENDPFQGGGGGGKPSGSTTFQGELNTIMMLGLLFLLLSTPQLDRIIAGMAPFLQGSELSRMLIKTLLFVMIAYLMMNWGLIRVSKKNPPQ
jgi:hypothetical protein